MRRFGSQYIVSAFGKGMYADSRWNDAHRLLNSNVTIAHE
jgi:hypothetical protein